MSTDRIMREYRRTSYVYFIRARGPGDLEYVKVGVAFDPKARLVELQVGCPLKLVLVGVIPDSGYKLEKEIHINLSEDNERGEWFRISDRMLPWLKKLEPLPPPPDYGEANFVRKIKDPYGHFVLWDLRTGDRMVKFKKEELADHVLEQLGGLSVLDARTKVKKIMDMAKGKAEKRRLETTQLG